MSMPKITLIGAGSTGFAKPFLVDIMSRPGLAGTTVSLMDVDAKKLAVTESLARKIARQLSAPNRIEAPPTGAGHWTARTTWCPWCCCTASSRTSTP
jgi:alpha-galactosidase/6-phospho-beta-glucosidase family protein